VSLLGAAVTYEEHGHLGVDYFVGKMAPEAQRVAAFAVELLVAFFAVFALMVGGYTLIEKTLASGQVSPALGVPMGYLYLSAPVSGFFFLLFSIEHVIELASGTRRGKSDMTDV
jgi:TRAP-type C4-dicarboxylate transport system permease small subunit